MLLNDEMPGLGMTLTLGELILPEQASPAIPGAPLRRSSMFVYFMRRRCVLMESRCTHTSAFGTRQAINEPMKEGGWHSEQQQQQEWEGERGGREEEATLWATRQLGENHISLLATYLKFTI